MSKAKLEAAREYIREGDYVSARQILGGIDHPKAKEWLAKLPPPPRNKAPTLTYAVLGLIAIILLGGVITAAFLFGRENMRTEFVENFAGAVGSAFDPNRETTTVDPNAPGGQNNPVPLGTSVELTGGTVIVNQLVRPAPFSLYNTSSFGNDEAEAIDGAEFVAVELEFTCGQDQVTCYTFVIDTQLILADGRIVAEKDDLRTANFFDTPFEIVSGSNVTLWEFYEVPQNAEASLISLAYNSNDPNDIVYVSLVD